jgi:hypothetical protein
MAGRRRLGVYAQLFRRRDSGAQLAVTARSIERLDGTYAIESERLLEKPQYQWPSRMAGKANSNASIAAIRHNRNSAAALSGNKGVMMARADLGNLQPEQYASAFGKDHGSWQTLSKSVMS